MCFSVVTSALNIYYLKFLWKMVIEQSLGKIIFGVIVVLFKNARCYTLGQNSDGLSSISTCHGQDQWNDFPPFILFIIITSLGLKFLLIVPNILPVFFSWQIPNGIFQSGFLHIFKLFKYLYNLSIIIPFFTISSLGESNAPFL